MSEIMIASISIRVVNLTPLSKLKSKLYAELPSDIILVRRDM